MKKRTRSLSGVTPIGVAPKPRGCPHGVCVYCPTLGVTQSYTPKSPAIMRAVREKYDPFRQIQTRISALEAIGHPTDKIELIIIGGTFLAYPEDYKREFVKGIYDGLNGFKSPNLNEAIKKNESASHRCVAFCVETRPDWCGMNEIREMLDFGVTRVELGVQVLNDEVYKLVKRGHTVQDVVDATRLLRDSGFKIGYHIMPGLPGSSMDLDKHTVDLMYSDDRFKPDNIKIYPTQVIKGSELVKWYEEGKYAPLTDDELKEILRYIMLKTPRWVRIMRVMRDIPWEYVVAGNRRIDMRAVVEKELRDEGKPCKCIRCREIGIATRRGEVPGTEQFLNVVHYIAAGGDEYYIEMIDENDLLYGMCRLRLTQNSAIDYLGEKVAFVRELHVYGKEVPLSGGVGWQHKGIGKALLSRAEQIALDHGFNKLVVISGVGVREYYRKLGYTLEGHYMVKQLN